VYLTPRPLARDGLIVCRFFSKRKGLAFNALRKWQGAVAIDYYR